MPPKKASNDDGSGKDKPGKKVSEEDAEPIILEVCEHFVHDIEPTDKCTPSTSSSRTDPTTLLTFKQILNQSTIYPNQL